MRLTLSRRKTQLFAAALCVVAVLPFLNGSVRRLTLPGSAPESMPTVRAFARTQSRVRTARPAGRQLAPAMASLLFAAARRTADASQADELFAAKSWYTPPPPPPPPPPAPEVAPTAPPLPYTYVGSYTDGSNATVYFVTREDRVYDVKAGDTLDHMYTLDVEAGQLIFTYKPLNVRQSLSLGGGS